MIYVVLAVAGAALIAIGVALWSLSAGLVAAGVELVAVAYGGAYIAARKGVKVA